MRRAHAVRCLRRERRPTHLSSPQLLALLYATAPPEAPADLVQKLVGELGHEGTSPLRDRRPPRRAGTHQSPGLYPLPRAHRRPIADDHRLTAQRSAAKKEDLEVQLPSQCNDLGVFGQELRLLPHIWVVHVNAKELLFGLPALSDDQFNPTEPVTVPIGELAEPLQLRAEVALVRCVWLQRVAPECPLRSRYHR